MNTYAYARVSSYDQNLARQLQRLQDFGINAKHIFFDKKSGKDFERINYRRMIKCLRQGDLLVITSIDRLGRNYNEIIEEWAKITKSIKADILVLDMPLRDTRSKKDTLLGKFISDIVLQILSFVAENERLNIRSRQTEGILLAKARGVHFGRPKRIFSNEECAAIESYLKKTASLDDTLASLHITASTFYYHLRNYRERLKFTDISRSTRNPEAST